MSHPYSVNRETPAMGGSGQKQGFTDSSLQRCEQHLVDGLRSIRFLLMLLVGKRPTFEPEEKASIIAALNAMENLLLRLSK